MKMAWTAMLSYVQKSLHAEVALLYHQRASLNSWLSPRKGPWFAYSWESAHCPAYYSNTDFISFLVNERLMVWSGARQSLALPARPGLCLRYRIWTGLSTKPCILVCLHSVYISDTKGALGGRSADQDGPRKWKEKEKGGPRGVIWCCHQCTPGESMLFRSHAANTPVFLLTFVNLFIYLNQITNKSKIKTGMWKFLCCGGLSKQAFI